MTGQTSQPYVLASRFLRAFQNLNKILATSLILNSFEDLNVSQLRILELVHASPGIRADAAITHLDLTPNSAKRLILIMEQEGLLALDRSVPGVPPALRLGGQGQRLAFQVNATQIAILAELLEKLSEESQISAIEALEHLGQQQTS